MTVKLSGIFAPMITNFRAGSEDLDLEAFGRNAAAHGAAVWQAGSLRLTSAERVAFELEGDLVGQLPATVGVQPGALRVIVP